MVGSIGSFNPYLNLAALQSGGPLTGAQGSSNVLNTLLAGLNAQTDLYIQGGPSGFDPSMVMLQQVMGDAMMAMQSQMVQQYLNMMGASGQRDMMSGQGQMNPQQLMQGLMQLLVMHLMGGGSLPGGSSMPAAGFPGAAMVNPTQSYGGLPSQGGSHRGNINGSGSQSTSAAGNVNMPPMTGNGLGDRLRHAIAEQESNGDPTVVNRDAAGADGRGIGAIGRYQMLGSNVAAWSKEAADAGVIPQDVAAQLNADPMAIRNMPEVQDRIASFKMEQYYKEALNKGYNGSDAVRYVASAWYSGDGDLLNSTRPQAGYPSIQAYTQSVLGKFNRLGGSVA